MMPTTDEQLRCLRQQVEDYEGTVKFLNSCIDGWRDMLEGKKEEITRLREQVNDFEHQLIEAGMEVSCQRARIKELEEGIKKHYRIVYGKHKVDGVQQYWTVTEEEDVDLYALLKGKEERR